MYALSRIIILLFDLYTLAILLRVLGSWLLASGIPIPTWAYNVLHALDQITSPVLKPIRRVIPPVAGMDISPIIAVLLLQILERVLLSALR
jgi:YggT family protein